jgi:glycosyltransferase involved in cell wall biosynthesis
MSLKRVDVLMATYNGAAYLREQIDSVLAQEGVALRLVVRDDGSRDATPAILADYAARYPEIVSVLTDSVQRGASENFMLLLQQPSQADYFAFCDQDDVWLKDKLITAVEALESSAAPVRLYCSAVSYVDESLEALGSSARQVTPSFNNALVENIAQGCTMVFDAALRQTVLQHLPDKAAMHDWWMYLVAAAFGRVLHDPVPHMLYRQHGRNVVGGGFSLTQKIRKNWLRYTSGKAWQMAAQADQLQQLYPDALSPVQKELIRQFIAGKHSLPARIAFLFDWRVRRQSFLETLVVKLLVLINAY